MNARSAGIAMAFAVACVVNASPVPMEFGAPAYGVYLFDADANGDGVVTTDEIDLVDAGYDYWGRRVEAMFGR